MKPSSTAVAVGLALVAAVSLCVPAAAVDEDVDLALLPRDAGKIEDAEARSLQIYRIPISFNLRRLEDNPWGLRLYLPVSLGAYELEATTDVQDFFARLQSVAIVPGVEFLLPVGDRWVIKPFGEVGVGDDSVTDSLSVLYSVGLRMRGEYQPDPFDVMVGGGLRYRNNTTSEAVRNWYSTVELGVDSQVPLGFSLGSRQAQGGAYVVLRHFPNLDFELFTADTVSVRWNYEAGVSFSTDPILKLWMVKIPWIGLGYRWGDGVQGVRLNFSFPF